MSENTTNPTEGNKADKKSKNGSASSWLQELLVPALAVLTGLLIGAIAIIASGENVFKAYGALFGGSFGSPQDIIAGIQTYFATGSNKELLRSIYPFTESLVTATPYIFASLAVAVGFRCGKNRKG